jgi:hypothetical protein
MGKYVIRELLVGVHLSNSYGNMWIIWRGPRVLSLQGRWEECPDVSEVMTFKSKRIANRTSFEWRGFAMEMDEAVEYGWVME